MFVQDVYEGLKGIERGRVKYIRVMETKPTSWNASSASETTRVHRLD